MRCARAGPGRFCVDVSPETLSCTIGLDAPGAINLDVVLGNVKRYEAGFFAAVALLGGLVWLARRWPRKTAARPKA